MNFWSSNEETQNLIKNDTEESIVKIDNIKNDQE
jgi:hypothetical protein